MLPWYLILYAGLYVVCLRSLKDYHLCKEPDAEDFQEDEQADWKNLIYNACVFTLIWWGPFIIGFMMGRFCS